MPFKKRIGAYVLAAVALAAPLASLADHGEGRKNFRAFLHGYEEVPAVNTPASGRLDLRIANDEQTVAYTLSYADLRGTITQAHIHFAQPGVNGGIMVWLCGTDTLPGPAAPNNPPRCPTPGGSVSGSIGAANVLGPAAQHLAAGDLASVIDAIRAGSAYANLHTTLAPGGEIRGQVDRR